MDVDYQGLYGLDYFGHNDGSVSFPPHFPEAFATIVRDVRGNCVLDVGAGNNELIRRLQPFGLGGFSLDLRGDEARSVLAFDLTRHDPSLIASVRGRIARGEAGSAHVTSCLDVLEHLDRKDLATAIWNLRELSAEWLLVSISTRPSSCYNLYHATVLPKRSWRILLAAAGFEIGTHDQLANLASCRVYPEHDENCWSVNQWRRMDPFRDASDPESYFLLLRRGQKPVDHAEFAAAAARILEPGDEAPSETFPLNPETHLVFLLVHYQDFLQYLPYWEALPTDRFTVLAPEDAFHSIDPRRRKALDAWMRSRGIRVERVKTVGEFAWEGVPGRRRALISASESSASMSHLISVAFVLEARVRGYATFQLQHGIWPHASFPEAIAFFSEYVLAWSDDFEDGFRRPRSVLPQNQFLVRGCAKFDDYARADAVEMADILGEWVREYRHKVLVATNLHWSVHMRGGEALPQLIATARAMPDTLFVCKLHPVHDVEESSLPPRPPNFLILDEFACLFGGIRTSSLVRASDAVVCTLSSVALEAAMAGKPFVILDTGNPNRFRGIEPLPIATMTEAVANMIATGPREQDRAFRDHYFASENFGRSLVASLETIEEKLAIVSSGSPQISPEAARAYAARYADFVMQFQPMRVPALEQEIEAGKQRIAALLVEVQSANESGSTWNRVANDLRERSDRDAKEREETARYVAMLEERTRGYESIIQELEGRIRRYEPLIGELEERIRRDEGLRSDLEKAEEELRKVLCEPHFDQ